VTRPDPDRVSRIEPDLRERSGRQGTRTDKIAGAVIPIAGAPAAGRDRFQGPGRPSQVIEPFVSARANALTDAAGGRAPLT